MPIFTLECKKCKHVMKDLIIGLSEIGFGPECNLTDANIKCEKCGNYLFTKVYEPAAKMSENWSSWNKK